ncbi:MAG TPA: SLBB domain-containing protein, partial [Candidatus Acidoferrales bacterium]|nr:SLBB domain-containing protein [Candidatus Acidoferrales bacterium]
MESILFPQGVPSGREDLEVYRARGGYEALRRAVKSKPEEVIQTISDAGLRGRGGAGFPTGKKWAFTRECAEQPRYLILNGGEDEPGSKKDRVLMENLPHLVIEGVILGAYAIGASRAYLYINANYEAATKSITDALAEAKAAGYWGKDVLGSGFDLDIELTPAPHNYVAGEDTAVIEVIEGKKAWPRQKPPFPVTVGLFGKPTSVNNVETLANVAPIILHGAEWYKAFGTAEAPGTMIFSLNDDVNRPGVYELPFGTPLRYLIEQCGGGVRGNAKI